MKRKIVKIDEEKCNGCGLCISGCHEGALQLIDGKARLVSESYCDGLGACLPECPAGAICIEERDADAFDETAVNANNATNHTTKQHSPNTPIQAIQQSESSACGCPGTRARVMDRTAKPATPIQPSQQPQAPESQLRQWPCQIKLVPANAPYLDKAHLLIAADCTAYAYANIHNDFMQNKITLIGCPKLDDTDYSEKLSAILMHNDIKSITVLRMEVPCCGGMVSAVKNAMLISNKLIPWNVTTISTNGNIIGE